MNIKSKLVSTSVAIALVTLIALGGTAYYSAKGALAAQVLENLESVAATQKHRLESIIEHNLERLGLVASRTQLRLSLRDHIDRPSATSRDTMNRILTDAAASISDIQGLFVQSHDGRIVAATDPELIGQIHATADYFRAGRLGNTVSLFHRDEGHRYRHGHGGLGLYLAGPLYLHEQPLGVLVIDADAANIIASITDYHGLGKTGETLLVRQDNGDDALFLTPARFDPNAALTRTIFAGNLQSPYVQALMKQEQLFTDAVDYTGNAVIAVTRYFDSTGWGLVVQRRQADAYAPIVALRHTLMLLSGVFAVAIVLVSLYVANSITRPITQLTRVAGRVSGGALEERADVSTADEVGLLAQAFNRMTQELVDDIHERQQAEEKFRALLKSAPDAIVIIDQAGKITLANLQAEGLFGYRSAELLGKPVEMLLPERHRRGHVAMRDGFFAKPSVRPIDEGFELFALHKNGTEIAVEISLAPIETADGLLVASSIRDITERKQAEARLLQQANFDDLTGLPNRSLAADRLPQAMARVRRTRKSLALMFLDVDNFKNINDTLGHAVGDQLLIEIAQRLSRCVRDDDTVARLGGDEFLIILDGLDSLTASEVVAEKILDSLSRPCSLNGRELFLSASIGITGYPEDGEQADVLMRNADAAMYRAKEAGRNTYRFFTPEMNTQLLKRLDMEARLRYAVDREELRICFQPQVDIRTRRVLGAEALLRWHNPELGLVPPDEFIPLAEESGLINAIGEWVLLHACRAAKTWQGIGGEPLRLSVNVSPVQFRGSDLAATVSRALAQSALPASLLELEITEHVLVRDNPGTSRILDDLKSLGVRLSLDDFGKGYSSLSYLKRYPFDVLKIDRTFVSGVPANPEDTALCKAITAMAGSLNLEVIAEGVETEEQWNYLSREGVDLVQGFYISKPLEGNRFIEFLRQHVHAIR